MKGKVLVNRHVSCLMCVLLCLVSSVGSAVAAPNGPASTNAKTVAGNLLGDSKNQEGPILIKSDTLSLDAKEQKFTYKGNVEARRGELVITADVMIGFYDDQSQIKRIICERNVVMTKGDGLRATAEKAIYSVADGSIELTENPEVIHDGNALTADKITYYVDEDKSEAEGDVRVKVVKEEST